MAALLLLACSPDKAVNPPVRSRQTSALTIAIAGPVQDEVMGQLSPIARFISAALREKRTRMAIREALQSMPPGSEGLDLSKCGSDPTLATLMSAGERGGAGNARALCRGLAARKGITLWMNPGWLRQWDGVRMPVVAAIDNPAVALPHHFKGYADRDRAIVLPADGSLNAPILVVLAPATLPAPKQGHH